MTDKGRKPESAGPEEEWVEESDEDWTEEKEWQEEAAAETRGAGTRPKQTPAYMTWLFGLIGMVFGLLAFKSCNP
ncbi:MAG: hypothetical protein Q8P31_09775 [Bacillota bacterium]|nr:hypothetical protein [Bacillota bacterium]